MIYLIDDKDIRQRDYGWNPAKIEKYKDVIQPIYTKKELDEIDKIELFNTKNIILFHESFFTNPKNKHEKHQDKIKQELLNLSEKNNMMMVFFSGSFGCRSINKNNASIPTEIIYKNLEFFVNKYKENHDDISIKHIVFGENFIEEEKILLKIEIWENIYTLNGIAEFKPFLMQLIERYNDLTGCEMNTTNCTIEYLKYQINNN